jgi:hypothetical protein
MTIRRPILQRRGSANDISQIQAFSQQKVIFSISSQKNMTFTQVLPTVSQLSHQDKLRLIHFLLLAVAKEEGCNLETSDSENTLLEQLAITDAIVWSPQTDSQSIEALSNLLATAQE